MVPAQCQFSNGANCQNCGTTKLELSLRSRASLPADGYPSLRNNEKRGAPNRMANSCSGLPLFRKYFLKLTMRNFKLPSYANTIIKGPLTLNGKTPMKTYL